MTRNQDAVPRIAEEKNLVRCTTPPPSKNPVRAQPATTTAGARLFAGFMGADREPPPLLRRGRRSHTVGIDTWRGRNGRPVGEDRAAPSTETGARFAQRVSIIRMTMASHPRTGRSAGAEMRLRICLRAR